MKDWLKNHPKAYILALILLYAIILLGVDIYYPSFQAANEAQQEDKASPDVELAQLKQKLTEKELGVADLKDQRMQGVTLADVQAHHPQYSLTELIQAIPTEDQPGDWRLKVVNPLFPLTEPVDIQTATASNGQLYDKRIEDPLNHLMEATQKAGYPLTIVSAYRDVNSQEKNRQSMIQMYQAGGASLEEAKAKTDAYVAPTHASEHSTGLALDLLGTDWVQAKRGLETDYAKEASAQWLRDHAQDYGFILRYLEGKEAVTGYDFEPWHYRYVGVSTAQYIKKYQLTLEEYLVLLAARQGQKLTYQVDPSLPTD